MAIPRITISSTLAIVITIILILSISIISFISYSISEREVNEYYNQQMIGTEELFNKSSIYIHRGLKLWDSTYNFDMSEIMQIFLE